MNRLSVLMTGLMMCTMIHMSNGQAGLRAGVNMASLKISVDFFGVPFNVTTDDKFGGHFGAFYKSKISERLTIRPNLLFTTGGGQAEDETTGETSSVSATYLGVPIDLMYSTPVGENTLSFVGGPYIGYLLSSSSDEDSGEDEFASMDYGINFGAEFQVNKVGIGLSYGIGLANVVPSETTELSFFANSSAKTRVVSLYVTYDL